jgi:hypothetical protein
MNGQLHFSLPGQVLFLALAQGTILKPIPSWQIESERVGHVNAKLSYVAEGIHWNATYNVIEPAVRGPLHLLGWITIHNLSGKTFRDAQVKLVAGRVNRI